MPLWTGRVLSRYVMGQQKGVQNYGINLVKFVQSYSNHQVLKSNTRPLNGGAGRVQKW